ncbi:MAG: AIR carboxylase family protein, partial [Gemmatimonadaceae bacterium]|nr:AIR carboxylase family protein [Gemmatimonadaceae bacterium]
GIPVGTLAIGKPGASNAGILAAEIVGTRLPEVRDRIRAWRDQRAAAVRAQTLP